jgi:hypothetical protein
MYTVKKLEVIPSYMLVPQINLPGSLGGGFFYLKIDIWVDLYAAHTYRYSNYINFFTV